MSSLTVCERHSPLLQAKCFIIEESLFSNLDKEDQEWLSSLNSCCIIWEKVTPNSKSQGLKEASSQVYALLNKIVRMLLMSESTNIIFLNSSSLRGAPSSGFLHFRTRCRVAKFAVSS